MATYAYQWTDGVVVTQARAAPRQSHFMIGAAAELGPFTRPQRWRVTHRVLPCISDPSAGRLVN